MNKNEFVFNDCDICINPNKLDGQVKKYRWEIETACADGKWVFGFMFDTPTSGWSSGAWSKDKENFPSEQDAVKAAAQRGISFFEREHKGGMNIPLQLFQELKELGRAPKPVQLTLF